MSKLVNILILENEDAKAKQINTNIFRSKIITDVKVFWTKDGILASDMNNSTNRKKIEDCDLEEGNVDIIVVDLKIDIHSDKYKNYGGISFLERIFRQPNPCLSVIVESENLRNIKSDCPDGAEVLEALKNKGKIITIDRNNLRDSDNPLLRQIVSSKVGRRILPTQLEQQIVFLGRTNDCVLMLGEAGTGKEGIAKALHNSWCENFHPGKTPPFITINAGALQYELLRSELFGYSKGAYTGATKGSVGQALKACGLNDWEVVSLYDKLDDSHSFQGTLFLDEIGNLDYICQGLLLRFLEAPYAIAPLGHNEIQNVRPRIIAATNNESWMEYAINGTQKKNEQVLRMDLFDRLARHILWIPTLKPEDVNGLIKTVSDEEWDKAAIEATTEYVEKGIIKGNIRGLINFIKRVELIFNNRDLGWWSFNKINEDLLKEAIKQALPEPHFYKRFSIVKEMMNTPSFKSSNGNIITEEQLIKALDYAKFRLFNNIPAASKDKPGELISKYGHIETELILLIWFYIYSKENKPKNISLEDFKCEGAKKWFITSSDSNAHKSVQQIAKRYLNYKDISMVQNRANELVMWCISMNKWPREMTSF